MNRTNGIFINSDAWNFWETDPGNMSRQGIMDDVDFYAKKGVAAVFYNLNFQRVFFPSESCTPIWKDCALAENGDLLLRGVKTSDYYKPHVLNCKLLWERLPDWMQFRYDYCHEKGIEMWHSMRMNDVHYTAAGGEHRPQHCDLWQERKDLLRAWYRHGWRNCWTDNAFDYGQPEVYEYHLQMAREYLLNWESDGIELDFMRAMPIFKPGSDEANKEILTQFLREIRNLTKEAEAKFGHPLRIAVRVPYRPVDAFGAGMDIPAWFREKLTDVIIPSPDGLCTEVPQDIEVWRALTPADVILAPCIDYNINSVYDHQLLMNNYSDNGTASSYYQMGADTVYLYNHFPRGVREGYTDMTDFFGYGNDRNETAKRKRRHIYTRHQTAGEGRIDEIISYPRAIPPHTACGSIKVNAGEQTAGRKARVVFGLRRPGLNVDVLLNTVQCPKTPGAPEGLTMPISTRGDQTRYYSAEIPAGVLHDGWNAVEFFNSGDTDISEWDFTWLEILIEPV